MENAKTHQAWLGLRAVFGVVPIVAGLDKFFNLLTNWESYLSPLATRVLPFSAGTFMRAVGLVEIAVGVMVLTRWTRVGAYLASAWLVLIALNLITTGHYLDVAARDLALAVGAFALGRLEEARAEARTTVRSSLTPAVSHT
jgi:uncharacterized membrane protein YphA (DoxX/SURF4 family)